MREGEVGERGGKVDDRGGEGSTSLEIKFSYALLTLLIDTCILCAKIAQKRL